MGNTAAVQNRNKDGFQSVIPGHPSAPNNTNTFESPRKRKLAGRNASGNEAELNLAEQDPANKAFYTSATPVTAKSDSVDRSESYRSDTSAFYDQTEGQLRREGMADCEFECSQISKYLYVGGMRIAENLELLKEKKITRIINCASSIIPNYHEGFSDFKYLSLNLVDGKVEDISWFVCEVIQFIFEGANEGQKTLLHCEKGISRSCSFAIAYRMWSTGEFSLFT
jgi:protein-tyrosine phosphatase